MKPDMKTQKIQHIGYYLRSRLWEFILCVIITFSASGILLNGFYIDPSRQGNVLLITGLAVLVSVVCFAGAYSKKSMAIAGAASVFVILAGVILIQIRELLKNIFRDEEENPGLFFLAVILTAVIVFFMTRTRTGTGILFIAGGFMTGAVQFLYETVDLYMMMLFIGSTGAMYIYKNYQRNVLETETVKTAFSRVFVISAAVCMVITLIACGLFYGIVKNMDPPERELKLITNYKALEVLEKVGIADTQNIYDNDELTDQTNDNQDESSQTGDDTDESDGDKQQQEDQDIQDERNDPNILDDSDDPQLYPIKYALSIYGPFIIAGLIILLIIAAVVIKKLLRRRWIHKVQQKTPGEQIIILYGFFINRFRKMKIEKKGSETPYEFATRSAAQTSVFCGESGIFDDITDIFVRTKYGSEPVKRADNERYLMFYRMFYKRCRKYLGTFRYILKFFIL